MFSSFAANAVLAKSRSKFGKMFTEREYSDMLNCKTVSEIASYLKTRTKYADCLAGYSPDIMHRNTLEACLRKYLFNEYESLYKYELSLGEKFSKYFTFKFEQEQISNCLSIIFTGRQEQYVYNVPSFMSKHSSINMDKIYSAKTLSELSDALSNTPYKQVLRPFIKIPDSEIDYAVVDSALQGFVFSEISDSIKKGFKGPTQKALMQLLGLQCDITNLSYIYRLKYVFKASNEYIRPLLIPFGTLLTEKEISYLLDDKISIGFFERLSNTPLRKLYKDLHSEYFELASGIVTYNLCKRNMRYSSKPPVILFSFILLAEIEVTNITHIIEGVRYNVPSDDIAKLIIGMNK